MGASSEDAPSPETDIPDPDRRDAVLARFLPCRPDGGAIVAIAGNLRVAGLVLALHPVAGIRRGLPAHFLGNLPDGALPENTVALLLACATLLLPPDSPARVWRRGPGASAHARVEAAAWRDRHRLHDPGLRRLERLAAGLDAFSGPPRIPAPRASASSARRARPASHATS